LLEHYAQGEVLSDRVASGDLGEFITPIEITVDKINNTIGSEMTVEAIVKSLSQLGFKTENNEGNLTVYVPSRRRDVKIKEDLIEEVARIYGYDEIPSTLPVFEQVTSGQLTDRQSKTRILKRTLEGAGLSEAITYSLVDRARGKA
ncbi:phenylalanine--tRNA ligase subunit beta, partial [Staphylococcus nepalensis]